MKKFHKVLHYIVLFNLLILGGEAIASDQNPETLYAPLPTAPTSIHTVYSGDETTRPANQSSGEYVTIDLTTTPTPVEADTETPRTYSYWPPSNWSDVTKNVVGVTAASILIAGAFGTAIGLYYWYCGPSDSPCNPLSDMILHIWP